MNLVIDIGNTRIKYTVFKDDDLILFDTDAILDFEKINDFKKKYTSINKCILSATGHIPNGAVDTIQTIVGNCIEFKQTTPLPFHSRYLTINTIGLDRLAAVAGADTLYPNKNVLIIDAGTAITYDLKISTGEHLGGNISPGMQMRFKALHTFTKHLPLLKANENINLLGNNTESAIINGVVVGITNEITGYIDALINDYTNLTIILTGGDAHFFENRLKKTIFVLPNLVGIGLNAILTHNEYGA